MLTNPDQPLPRFLSASYASWEESEDFAPPSLVVHTHHPRCILTIHNITDDDGEIINIRPEPVLWLDPEPAPEKTKDLLRDARKFHYHHITYSAQLFDEKFEDEIRKLNYPPKP